MIICWNYMERYLIFKFSPSVLLTWWWKINSNDESILFSRKIQAHYSVFNYLHVKFQINILVHLNNKFDFELTEHNNKKKQYFTESKTEERDIFQRSNMDCFLDSPFFPRKNQRQICHSIGERPSLVLPIPHVVPPSLASLEQTSERRTYG